MKSIRILVAAFVSTLALSVTHAGEPVVHKSSRPALRDYPFEKGATELQVLVGPMFSLNNGGTNRPTVNDVTLAARYGVMLSTASGDRALRGNFEMLGELFGSAIYDGPGDGIAGASLLFRYNFVRPKAKFVPYIQGGGGGAYSNISDDQRQRLVGSEWSFNLQAALGARYMFSERCALSVEAAYRHISNANTADRNFGLNQVGGLVGFSVFF